MEKDGGVYKIPCTVNGAKLKMILDTGASHVSLSKTMAEYLFENGYLVESDIMGKSIVSFADGSSAEETNVLIRDIEISGLHLRNVKASISNSSMAPLLLGQSAIQKLGAITIDKDFLIIKNGSTLTKAQLQDIYDRIGKSLENNSYYSAITDLELLRTSGYCEPVDYKWLSILYISTNQYDKCIEIAEEFSTITIDENEEDHLNYAAEIYSQAADSYTLKNDASNPKCSEWGYKALPYAEKANNYYALYACHSALAEYESKYNRFLSSISHLEKAISNYRLHLDLKEGEMVNDNLLANLYFHAALIRVDHYVNSDSKSTEFINHAYQCGKKDAYESFNKYVEATKKLRMDN